MKKLAIFQLLLVLPLYFSHAQNWAPLNKNEKFNYRLTGAKTVSAQIKVDSAKLVNGDSVYYLNRIAKINCDSCFEGYSITSNLPQFLQKQVTLKGNGVYNFTDTLNLALYALCPLNYSWLYDTTNGISAQMTDLDTDIIFGTVDSIRTIQLSTGDTIILSKSYGIIRYPYKYGVVDSFYTLTGIEGLNVGEKLPNFKDMFNWNVGDIFEYSYYFSYSESLGGATYNGTMKLTVKSKYQNGDTLKYEVSQLSGLLLTGLGRPTYTSKIVTDTLVFIDSVNHFANNYPNQLSDSNGYKFKDYFSSGGISTPGYTYFGSDSTGKTTIQLYQPTVYDTLITERVAYSYINVVPPNTGTYTQGLGITAYNFCNDYDASIYGYGYTEAWGMTAYRKGNDTVGTLTPDSVLQATATTAPQPQQQAKVYPNPANNYITVALKDIQQSTITLNNLQGQLIKKENTNSNLTTIDISELPAGMYLLSITTETGTEYVKVVKQ